MHVLIAVVTGALMAALVATRRVHASLCEVFAARGMNAWRYRDTLASAPLILMGSAALGGLVVWVAMLMLGLATSPLSATTSLVLIVSSLLTSMFVLLLGILALRKFH